MRIIAGRFKGRKLPSLKIAGLRPTTDRVREALFSVIGTAVRGARVLELFAGAGAFGFEALSRGASGVTFVDRDGRAARYLAKGIRLFGVGSAGTVLTMDALHALEYLGGQGRTFDLVFLDPPYGTDWISRVLSHPGLSSLVEPGGFLVTETEARLKETAEPECFTKAFSRKYGDTFLEMFKREFSGESDSHQRGRPVQ